MDLGITKSGTIRHQITNSMSQYWFQLLLLCYKPPQISGIKTNIYFIMCMASVSQKFRNNIVETACLLRDIWSLSWEGLRAGGESAVGVWN